MTSNVPFKKNKMASTLAASVITTWSVHKMQEEAERNRKRCREEVEFLVKLPAGKLFCKFHTTTKRHGIIV